MRLILFGPPGAGKGTQAEFLISRYRLAHISTGAIIRAAMAAGTPAGLEAKRYVASGQLVPGEVVRRLAEDAIEEAGLDQFILDGYPRTVEQAEWLTAFLDAHGAKIDAVISLDVPDEEIVARLADRRVHRVSGESYHLVFLPPPPGVDPADVIQRPDDQPEAIRNRLRVYKTETQPVEAYYAERQNLYQVNASGAVEEVARRVQALIEQAAPDAG